MSASASLVSFTYKICTLSIYLIIRNLALLNELLLAKSLLDSVDGNNALVPRDGDRAPRAHLGINTHGEAPSQRGGEGDISHGDLVLATQPGAVLQVGVEEGERTLQALEGVVLHRFVIGLGPPPPQCQLDDILHDFTVGKANPLSDGDALDKSTTHQLLGGWATQSDILRNGIRLEQVGAVGALESGHLAVGELGQEFRRAVGLAHDEVREGELQAVEVGCRLDLLGVWISSYQEQASRPHALS